MTWQGLKSASAADDSSVSDNVTEPRLRCKRQQKEPEKGE